MFKRIKVLTTKVITLSSKTNILCQRGWQLLFLFSKKKTAAPGSQLKDIQILTSLNTLLKSTAYIRFLIFFSLICLKGQCFSPGQNSQLKIQFSVAQKTARFFLYLKTALFKSIQTLKRTWQVPKMQQAAYLVDEKITKKH